jgi:AcrR family transcriptional regulator
VSLPSPPEPDPASDPTPEPAPESIPESTPKRDAILRAALDLFSERTYEGTAVPVVAERAGVGAGTVYRYFPSKQVLANVIFQDCKLVMTRSLSEGLPPGLSLRAEFAWMWRQIWEFARDLPEAFRFLEMHHHAGYLDDTSRAARDSFFAHIRAFIRRGQQSGIVRGEAPEVLVAIVLGAFVGLVRMEADGHLRFDEDTLEESEQAVWSMLSA